MAISRERLEELIKQSATIYNVDYNSNTVEPINLLFTTIDGNTRHIKGEEEGTIFETQEQAEWHLKYHATRTEELNLPTWEEFDKNNKTICFTAKDWQCYELGFAFGDAETICLDKIVLGVNTNQKTWKATEENYEKACDLCLKLFKGEEE